MNEDEALTYGSQGVDVQDVQARLQFLGYYAGAIDGNYGVSTFNGVEYYQRAMGHDVAVPGSIDFHGVQQLHEASDPYGYDPATGLAGGYHQNSAPGEPAETQAAHHEHSGHHEHHGHSEHGHRGHHGHAAQPDLTATVDPNAIAAIYSFDAGQEEPVHADHNLTAWAKQGVVNLNTRLLTVAQANDTAFRDACEDFRREYMKARVKQYQESNASAEDFAKQVVTGIAAYAGIRVLEPFAKGVGKHILEQISIYLGGEAANAAKAAVQDAGLGNQLESALGDVIAGLAANMATMHDYLNTNLNALMQPVTDRLNSGQPLDPGDAEWVSRCYQGDASGLDAVIEEYFGVIAPAHLTRMKDAVFEHLVEQFTLAMIERTEDHSSRLFFDRRTEGEQWRDDPHRRARVEARDALDVHKSQRHGRETTLGLHPDQH